MTKNIGIITTGDGDVVIDGDMNVGDSNGTSGGANVGIITTGGGSIVVNGAFNVGGKSDESEDDAK